MAGRKKTKKIAKIFIFSRIHLEIDVLELEGGCFSSFHANYSPLLVILSQLSIPVWGSSVVKFGPQMKSVHPTEGLFSELPLCFRHGAAENSGRKAPVLHPTVGILKK